MPIPKWVPFHFQIPRFPYNQDLTPKTMETINAAPLAVRYDLPGSYRGNEIQVERIVVPGSNRIFVNLHGTYGIMHGNS